MAGALLLAFACTSDTPTARTDPRGLESGPVATSGAVRGTVDLITGTLTFEPAMPESRATALRGHRINATIYGDQNVTVRLYNTPVQVAPSSPGKKTFTANVGLQNLLPHPIGDEQAGAIPRDTMGIYVFFTREPAVTRTSSPCGACAVTVQNHHGSLTFLAASQKYFHWGERMSASGTVTGDTTLSRKTWTFQADTQVTGFEFEVLVSTAWPPPDGTRWKIDYQADSLPSSGTEPGWRPSANAVPPAVGATGGVLRITAPINADVTYHRRDSLAVGTNAWIESRIRAAATSTTIGDTRIAIDDGTRLVIMGVGSDRAGFVNSANGFIGTPFVTTTNVFRVYRLAKYGGDSAVFFVDGVRRDALAYTSFSLNPFGAFAPLVGFGTRAGATPSTGEYDYVIYEIGAAQP